MSMRLTNAVIPRKRRCIAISQCLCFSLFCLYGISTAQHTGLVSCCRTGIGYPPYRWSGEADSLLIRYEGRRVSVTLNRSDSSLMVTPGEGKARAISLPDLVLTGYPWKSSSYAFVEQLDSRLVVLAKWEITYSNRFIHSSEYHIATAVIDTGGRVLSRSRIVPSIARGAFPSALGSDHSCPFELIALDSSGNPSCAPGRTESVVVSAWDFERDGYCEIVVQVDRTIHSIPEDRSIEVHVLRYDPVTGAIGPLTHTGSLRGEHELPLLITLARQVLFP